MYKYLGGCMTLEQLKAAYRKLAMQLHPDHGGDEAEMMTLNNEYDELAGILPKTASTGETYQPKDREAPEEFRAAVMVAMGMDGVEIELCGCWLWVTGETKQHKEQLKAAGYKWSANKSAWYWHEGGYKRRSHSHYSMDEIREMHGSERVTYAARAAITQ